MVLKATKCVQLVNAKGSVKYQVFANVPRGRHIVRQRERVGKRTLRNVTLDSNEKRKCWSLNLLYVFSSIYSVSVPSLLAMSIVLLALFMDGIRQSARPWLWQPQWHKTTNNDKLNKQKN